MCRHESVVWGVVVEVSTYLTAESAEGKGGQNLSVVRVLSGWKLKLCQTSRFD